MKADYRCRWVRPRLPLLAGGELGVQERRRVERHLIGCPDCRDRRDASGEALTVLRAFAERPPARVDSPSLWPALASQIRQSRHVAPSPSWWELSLLRPWGAFSLAMGLGAVLAAAFVQPSRREAIGPPAVADVPSDVAVEPEPIMITSRGALPDGPARPPGALPRDIGNPAGPVSASEFNYDLDHMTPMGPGNRDPQRSY
jgi:hypothetical protein